MGRLCANQMCDTLYLNNHQVLPITSSIDQNGGGKLNIFFFQSNINWRTMLGFMMLVLKSLTCLLQRFHLLPKEIVRSYRVHSLLPPATHIKLPEAKLQKRLLLIGDVHGCYVELKELLERCNALDNETTIVLTGDLVNKGPDSVKTVNFARTIGAFSVRGNHDQSALEQINHRRKNEQVREKYKWIVDLAADDEKYLEEMPYTITIDLKEGIRLIVVHGGLVPGVPLEKQIHSEMVTIRSYIPEQLRCTSSSEGVPWASVWAGPEHAVFGHDARRGLQEYRFAVGLDTGCVYGGLLTGILVEDGHWEKRKIVQVKARESYAPK